MNGYMDHNIIQFECEEYVGILRGILSVPQNKHVYHNNVMHGSHLFNTMVKHGGLNHVFKSNVFVSIDYLSLLLGKLVAFKTVNIIYVKIYGIIMNISPAKERYTLNSSISRVWQPKCMRYLGVVNVVRTWMYDEREIA